jgi:hypothetical protein
MESQNSEGIRQCIVSWQTDKPSSSQVQYGIYPNPDTVTPIYSDPSKGDAGVIVHQVNLTNLLPATSYSYRAISIDTNGNKTVSPDMQFTTGGIASPKAYKPAKCDVKISATDEKTIAWTAGTLIFVDGTKQEITAGTADLIELKTNYVYWVAGKKALQLATSPSQATGQDSGIIAMVVPGYLLQPPSLKAAISMVD